MFSCSCLGDIDKYFSDLGKSLVSPPVLLAPPKIHSKSHQSYLITPKYIYDQSNTDLFLVVVVLGFCFGSVLFCFVLFAKVIDHIDIPVNSFL